MGRDQSKDESLLEQVGYGNLEGIRALVREGADLECTDCQGKTPLMVACITQDIRAVTLLIELGANVNALCPRRKGGGPLHFAAWRDHVEIVNLLLVHGANALSTNDTHQMPLDVARGKGYTRTVRAIEDHECLFSGWLLQELYSSRGSRASQLRSTKVWVVVLPLSFCNNQRPLELELAIYTDKQDAQPHKVVSLRRAKIVEPNLNKPDPVAIISDIGRIPLHWREWRRIKPNQEANGQIKLAPPHQNEKHQLRRFFDACNGISQNHAALPSAPLEGSNRVVQNSEPSGNNDPKITADISACKICFAAPVEGAFAPCGHMVGCMLCMNMTKSLKHDCPICRSPIDQVIRLYSV